MHRALGHDLETIEKGQGCGANVERDVASYDSQESLDQPTKEEERKVGRLAL